MIQQFLTGRKNQILIDVGTQKDFFLAEGKACVRNHRRVLANIRRMMAWARYFNIPVVSTCEVYPTNGSTAKHNYCIDGTAGQKKIHYTTMAKRTNFPADGDTNLPGDVFKHHRQAIFHSRCENPFEEPRIERILSEVNADEFIVLGAQTQQAVQATVLGLLQRGKRVVVVADAVGSQDHKEEKLALRKMKAKGASLVKTKNIAGKSHLKQVRLCNCPQCNGVTAKFSFPGF